MPKERTIKKELKNINILKERRSSKEESTTPFSKKIKESLFEKTPKIRNKEIAKNKKNYKLESEDISLMKYYCEFTKQKLNYKNKSNITIAKKFINRYKVFHYKRIDTLKEALKIVLEELFLYEIYKQDKTLFQTNMKFNMLLSEEAKNYLFKVYEIIEPIPVKEKIEIRTNSVYNSYKERHFKEDPKEFKFTKVHAKAIVAYSGDAMYSKFFSDKEMKELEPYIQEIDNYFEQKEREEV